MIDYQVPTRNEKTYEEHREHFIYRLKERYGITITDSHYDAMCTNLNTYYKGMFKKGGYRSVGILNIDGVDTLVSYYRHLSCFTTALPITNMDSPQELIQSCFARTIRHLAYYILERILEELTTAPKDFDTAKDAAIYYFSNHLFPTLLIDQYKHGSVCNFRIMRQINSILFGMSEHVKIDLKKINRLNSDIQNNGASPMSMPNEPNPDNQK